MEGPEGKFAHTYIRLEPERQALLLGKVAHDLTVAARVARVAPHGSDVTLAQLIAINELQHLLSGQLVHLSAGDEQRYPDDVFLAILQETAKKGGVAPQLGDALERALVAFRSRVSSG